ncbi:hypothetical protein LTR99_010344 [Exophiala xenobiotica]|uniref:Uncharacterized protein n=1 Tax=Vermiconidia calcicola TaxID=1690605 RepID=A0AAV9Q568_9PEZI|nr:hypothetical protein LTR96_010562 [Exophiala xenobiotica]KAK5534063.1 hypothetical protein LTR25_007043 [Vermiconidia calcicola]KAK5538104.1 hypothetical protein LTR23_007241 [Chaetothyriales sp. CCFEE 6169]KAK5292596.1 hypothetical protein LTR99_010344 [Exophiala xenobiotica]KAK5342273.1 hypothetical protein LTR98_003067 [Exophiala xenobiotica]
MSRLDIESTASNEPAGVSTGNSAYKGSFPSAHNSLVEKSPNRRMTELSDAQLSHQVSKVIHLEPPPVVVRPPKIKNDGFSHHAFSWLSWSRNEQKDRSRCARSTHHSYSVEKTFQFLGFTISKAITYKTSESGIDTARATTRLGWRGNETTWSDDKLPKARQRLKQYSRREPFDPSIAATQENGASGPDIERQKPPKDSGQPRTIPSGAHPWLHDYYYVVVGFMGDESVPKETLRRVVHTEGLFQEIRKAQRHLRNPFRRALSLKEVSGFGIYECDSSKGYHREVELDKETHRALAELWRNFSGNKLDYEGRWLMWIHQHFNNGSKNPEMGRLTLEFKLRWSVYKVVFWGVVPILLTLAVGFWYMFSDHGEVDDVAVAEAAWVISTYIITTSACE